MCEFCNVEPGDCIEYGVQDIELKVGDRVVGEESLDLGYYLNDEEVPESMLTASYWVDNSRMKASVTIPIKYCPFCGRKLHND